MVSKIDGSYYKNLVVLYCNYQLRPLGLLCLSPPIVPCMPLSVPTLLRRISCEAPMELGGGFFDESEVFLFIDNFDMHFVRHDEQCPSIPG
jgi:hypothetical protein